MGYTSYLGATELEHAQDVLADLTETVVASLRPTFRIAELEGDAVFAYALEGELEAATLFDAVDQTYFSFRSRSRDVVQATACTCEACRRIPALDLKSRHRPVDVHVRACRADRGPHRAADAGGAAGGATAVAVDAHAATDDGEHAEEPGPPRPGARRGITLLGHFLGTGEEIDALPKRMAKANVDQVIVTHPDGRLDGVYHRQTAPVSG